MTRRFVVALVAVSVLFAGACASDPNDTPSAQHGRSTATLTNLDPVPVAEKPTPQLPVTVKSFDGSDTTVTDVSRIIAVDRYGTLTQTIFALGLGDNVVGRSSSAAFPAVKDRPDVARGGALGVEAVLALRPTVLLTDTVTVQPTTAEQLRSAGLTVVYFDPNRSLDGVAPQIEAVANALGVPEQGKALAARSKQEIAAVDIPKQDKPLRIAFLYLRGPAITMLAGPGSGADQLIEALGGEDAGTAAGLKEQFQPITSEAMVAAAPDVFLMMTDGLDSIGGPSGLAKLPGVAQTPAGRNERVVDMADSVLLSFGPNTGHVLQALSTAVYPPK